MVRFLKTMYEKFDNADDLDRYITIERIVAATYIPAASCLAMGALGRSGIVPYATAHEWKLFMCASIYLTLANGRDVNHGIRCFFMLGGTSAPRRMRGGRSWGSRSPLGPIGLSEASIGVGAQMQMGAAIALTVGSLSLLNASVIALLAGRGGETELCRRQFAAAFGMMVVGAAANAVGGGQDEPVGETVANMRMVVGFQNVVASAALCVGGVLMLPSMKPAETGLELQTSLIIISSLVGSIFTVLSSIMNYFHTVALLWAQEEAFERRILINHRQVKRYYDRELVPLYRYAREGGAGGDVHVEVMEDDEEVDEESSDDSMVDRGQRVRRERRFKRGEEVEERYQPGLFARVRNAIRSRGNRLLWGVDNESSGEIRRKQGKKSKRRRAATSSSSRTKKRLNEEEEEDIDEVKGKLEEDDEEDESERQRTSLRFVAFETSPSSRDNMPSSTSSMVYETDTVGTVTTDDAQRAMEGEARARTG